MATSRILHDRFRALCSSFGRMNKTEFTRTLYFDFSEWPVSAFVLAICPVVGAVKYYLGPKGDDYHRYFKNYTISRAKDPG